MPRKNKHKKEARYHCATIYDSNFKQECYGCAFAGHDFKCLTSDGTCLKNIVATKDSKNAEPK
ncbi:MAG: hypothetical protein FWG87_00405 [Defluviitaleaceae bacterium]|nr:hypothetical protein [Defluviitaleaceae bacterium]